VLPYDTHQRKLRLAMSIGGDYGLVNYRSPWPAAARDLGLDSGALHDVVLGLTDRVADAFLDAANAEDVRALSRALPARLVDLVRSRAERCRKILHEPYG
jgi:serine/threonine-protein kinase HipA